MVAKVDVAAATSLLTVVEAAAWVGIGVRTPAGDVRDTGESIPTAAKGLKLDGQV
jgi:hypothetical protein